MSFSFLAAARRRSHDVYKSVADPVENAFRLTTPPRPALHDAAKHGNIQRLSQLVDEQPDQLDERRFGYAPIHLAAKGGHANAVTLLLDRRSDVNVRALNGSTPLHSAAEADSTEVITLLLSRGADLHAEAVNRDTVLHVAALNGRMAASRLLVARGADVESKNECGITPLEDAQHLGRGRCACEDPNARDWQLVAAFLTHVLPMTPEDRVQWARRACERPTATVLHDAAELGNAAHLARLLELSAESIDARDYDGSAAIHAAVEGGHLATTALLVDWHADLGAVNNYQDTALHVAARHGHEAIGNLLIARGANVHAADRFGATPLDVARRHRQGSWETLAKLLEVEARDFSELDPGERARRKVRAAFMAQERAAPTRLLATLRQQHAAAVERAADDARLRPNPMANTLMTSAAPRALQRETLVVPPLARPAPRRTQQMEASASVPYEPGDAAQVQGSCSAPTAASAPAARSGKRQPIVMRPRHV